MPEVSTFIIQGLCILILVHDSSCNHDCISYNNTYDVVTALKKELLSNRSYDPSTVPSRNQSATLELRVFLNMYSLNSVDEINQLIETSAYVGLFWYDEIIAWNGSDYGVCGLYFKQDQIWTPQLYLTNSAVVEGGLGHSNYPTYVSASGDVDWWPFKVSTTTCSMNVYYYPFDEQTCSLEFSVLGYTLNQISMDPTSEISLEFLTKNSKWEVEASGVDIIGLGADPVLNFHLKIKRRPAYVMIANVIPVILLSILNVTVFILPNSCGEKVGYVITVFLSFAVLMTLVLATIPQNSLVVSLFEIYLFFLTIQSTIITIVTLICVRISMFDDAGKPVHPVLLGCYRIFYCKGRNERRKRKNNRVAIKVVQDTKSDGQNEEADLSEDNGDEQNREVIQTVTWSEIVNFLDKVCFVLFSSSLIICSAAFFLSVLRNKMNP